MDELTRLREEIDSIDKELASLFERRMEVSARIGEVKRIMGSCILDAEREKEVMESREGYLKMPHFFRTGRRR